MSSKNMQLLTLEKRASAMWWVALYSIKDIINFRSKLVLDVSMTLFRVLVLLFVYVNIYQIAPQVGTVLPFQSAMWSIGAYFIALSFNARRVARDLSMMVWRGNFELFVTRPFNVVAYTIARMLGVSFVQAMITTGVVLTFLVAVVGAPVGGWSIEKVIGMILLTIGGITVEALSASTIGLLAMWLENINPIYLIIDKMILIFGGSYVPVAFFPYALQLFAKYSPFGAMRFAGYVFYPSSETPLWQYGLLQVFWIVALFFLLSFVYRRAMKSLFVNGS